MNLTLHTDGGARGNPGPAAIGIVIKDSKGKTIYESGRFIGITTNNDAEYTALVDGLNACIEKTKDKVTCYLDSELIVKQLNGEYKVKSPTLKIHFNKIMKLRSEFKTVEFIHVLRSKNKDADLLVNQVLDSMNHA